MVRLLIVDDHAVVRDGIRWMLGNGDGVEVSGEAGSAAEAMEAISSDCPDVLLLDIHLPDVSGLELLKDIRKRFPDLPVVMLTMSDDPEYVEEAIRAGAAGYLLKSVTREELIRAVRSAAAGDGYIQAEVTQPLLARFAADVRESDSGPKLSPREREVVSMLAEGLPNKRIAAKLGIAEPTAKGYLRSVYEKLGAADRAQAVAIAMRSHLIE